MGRCRNCQVPLLILTVALARCMRPSKLPNRFNGFFAGRTSRYEAHNLTRHLHEKRKPLKRFGAKRAFNSPG